MTIKTIVMTVKTMVKTIVMTIVLIVMTISLNSHDYSLHHDNRITLSQFVYKFVHMPATRFYCDVRKCDPKDRTNDKQIDIAWLIYIGREVIEKELLNSVLVS